MALSLLSDNLQHPFVYGTSGFRAEATMLHQVVRRTAFYAANRARILGKSMGLMITASHNPVQDNGIKLIDPSGQMLPMECEKELTLLVNMSEQEFIRYQEDIKKMPTPEDSISKTVSVLIATDTRPSSPGLYLEAILGVGTYGNRVNVEFFEHHTTPQLHFIVRAVNNSNYSGGYISYFRQAFAASFELIPFSESHRYTKQLFVDCANGVGALWVGKYLNQLELGDIDDEVQDSADEDSVTIVNPIDLTLINTQTGNGGILLNHECGADYVKIHSRIPADFDKIPCGSRCASLDGDADRIVYFYPTENGNVELLDGDHIAAIFTKFIMEQINEAQQLGQPIPLTFGVVQTAYANGNSTRYFKNQLGLKPVLTKTGVKYLEEAARKFDIGVYFEANGHGTVYFSSKFLEFLDTFRKLKKADRPRHIRLLALFSQLVNDVVGDGIADMLAVECLLRHFDWSIQDWGNQTYRNMPNIQLKVPVQDRSIWATAEENETQLIRPVGIQDKIDKIVEQFDEARAFVRPSGTEQILRVYVEAQSKEEARLLAEKLSQLVRDNAN